MNYFEFKQQLLKDSFTKDEEFHRLRKEDIRCDKAYEEAMEFERKLKKAFDIKAPETLRDSIILRQATEKSLTTTIRHYAIAASLLVSMVLVAGFWYQKQPGPLEKFVNQALIMEPIEYMSEKELPEAEIQELFASLNTKVNGDLGKVHFMKTCPTPNGMGARMVLMTDSGPVTILYMPNADIDQRIEFELENYKGSLIALENGAAAIIGEPSQSFSLVEARLQNSLSRLK
jgi:hypothetical protein